MNNINLTTAPYKGTADVYPEEMLLRSYLFDIWTKVAKKYGYEEYDTPMLEDADLYRAKSGEELANTQLYNFVDKGGREVALRPEMTPSLARMIAARQSELQIPIRWFNIGRYYRYEKPQKGRRREFFQLNIDVFGIEDIEAELEVIQFVMDVMKELNAPKNAFELRINNRYLLDYLFIDILNLSQSIIPQLARAIDNYSKMTSNDFKEYILEIGLNTDQLDKVMDYLTWDLSNLESIKEKSKGAQQLLKLFDRANTLGISNITFNPSIMRGIQYYTGTVIEMFDIGSKENPRALFGGGRYDDLLTIFGKDRLPAFGLGWGDITMMDFLKTYNLLPNIKTNTQVYVTLMDDSLYTQTSRVVKSLRDANINVLQCIKSEKLKKQLQEADRRMIKWVVILGEDELKEEKVQLKNMTTGESIKVSIDECIQKIKCI